MMSGSESEYPRVITLVYRIASDEVHQYAEDAELSDTLGNFAFRLHRRNAEFRPLVRFAKEEDARAELEPQLRAWELDAAIKHGPGAFAFMFLTSHIQQEAPKPGVIKVPGAAMTLTGGSPTTTLTYKHYPTPPRGFVVDECVQTLGELFLLARTVSLVLLYIAYSMTTCLEYY